jgi:hypothetical protein
MAAQVRIRLTADLALVALAGCAAVLAATGGSSPLRLAVGLLCTTLLPGAAVLTRIECADAVMWLGLAVGSSLAIEALVAAVTLWLHVWHPAATNLALGLISSLLLIDDARRHVRPPRKSEAG